MNHVRAKLKFILPAAALSLAGGAVAITGSHPVKRTAAQQPRSTMVPAPDPANTKAASLHVEVNGQPISVPDHGTVQVHSGGGTTTVTTNLSTPTPATGNQNSGTLHVNVSHQTSGSASLNGFSSTNVYQSDDQSISTQSDTTVETNGAEVNINTSNN